MVGRKIFATGLVVAFAGGCWTGDEQTLPAGNATLGIVKFVEEQGGDQTTLRGLDASGNEVARLDLVHGRFTVSPPFTDDYETPEVDGRKLNIVALGQLLNWETAGFDPVLEMPAHPASQWALAAFVADPHAKAILDRWQIGFERSVGDGEIAYASGSFRGDSPQTCDGLTACGFAWNSLPVNMCGGGAAATHAARVTQQPGTNCGFYTGPTAQPEIRVAQCCPGTPTFNVTWYAEKACRTTASTTTSCGVIGSGACKSCPAYPVDANQVCTASTGSTVGSCSSVPLYPLNWSFTGSISDDFNRTSGMGANWYVSEGGYNTDGNYAVSTTASNYGRWIASPPGADYSVMAKITPSAGASNAGLFARNTSANPSFDLYAAAMSTAGFVTLRRQNNSTWTWLEQTTATITAGTEYELKMVVTGVNPVRVEVWLDGVLKISYSDSSASRITTAGLAGIHCQNSSVKYNAFEVAQAIPLNPVPGLPYTLEGFELAGNSLGGKWITEWGTFISDGTFAIGNGTSLQNSMPVVNLGTNDYMVQTTVQVPASAKHAGVYARASDPEAGMNTYYAATISTTGIELARYNNFAYTFLGNYLTPISTGTNYNIKLTVTGSNPVALRVQLDDVQRISYDDSSASRIMTGDVGISARSGSTGVKWDSFMIDAVGAPPPTYYLYTDSLQNGWQDWGWDSTRNFSNTSPVYAGANSISVSYFSGLFGGLYFGRNTGISTVGKTNLRAVVRAVTANTLLQVYATVGGTDKIYLNLEGYCGGSLPANTWVVCTIPLSDLQASGVSNLTGIVFKKRETPARTVYYDQVSLE